MEMQTERIAHSIKAKENKALAGTISAATRALLKASNLLEVRWELSIFGKKNKGIMTHKIYVASSWRNEFHPDVVEALREEGHEVYDFRNPPSGDPGFKWSNIDSNYMEWTPQEYSQMLSHPMAKTQFKNDIEAMKECDICVLVLPCGRSAHTEAGWFAGQGKKTIAYIPTKQEPELMYKLFDVVCCTMEELISCLNQ